MSIGMLVTAPAQGLVYWPAYVCSKQVVQNGSQDWTLVHLLGMRSTKVGLLYIYIFIFAFTLCAQLTVLCCQAYEWEQALC
jgi:hypothetical protein